MIEPQFVRAGAFYNGKAGVSVFAEGSYNELYYIIDESGNRVADLSGTEYFSVSMGEQRELMRVAPFVDGATYKTGYIDYNGNMVIDAIYDTGNMFISDMSYARVQYNGLWGMIDQNGNWLIEANFLKLVG